jgi:ketosteroid isomerase-like protein
MTEMQQRPTTGLAAARALNEATFAEFLRRFDARRFADALELWTGDARIVLVGASNAATPVVLDREAMLATWQGLGAALAETTACVERFHQTDDPAVAFVERRMEGVLRTGTAIALWSLDRVTFRDGRIAELREHVDPREHERLMSAVHAAARIAA